MKHFTRNLLLLALSVSGTSGLLQAQQSVNKKGTATLSNLQAVKPDNVHLQEVKLDKVEMKSKEISREVAMPKNGEVYIENNSRNIVIKTWDQSKVKISTTVLYEGEGNFTEEEWFEKANLSLKTLGSSVKIKAGLITTSISYGTTLYNKTAGNLTETVFTGQAMPSTKSSKKLVTVYLPVGSKIDIESKYSEVTLPANIGDVNAEISNGNLDAENLGKLTLRSQYAIVNIGDVKTAEIEFTGGRLTARNIDDLDLDSKYSTIELALVKKVIVRSTNDEYEFEEVGEISGRKNYGNLRITRLLQKIEMEGANADIKIRNIAPTVSLVKIDDKYADIRLPVKNTKNYSIDFTGAYSAVYGNFEKKVPINLKLSSPNTTVSDHIISDTGLVPRTSGSVNTGRNNVSSLGNLTAITVEGRPLPTAVSGTITGGTFSGTLSSGPVNNIIVPGTIVGGTFSGTLSSSNNGQSAYRSVSDVRTASGQPATAGMQTVNNITTLGNLTALTVSGYITNADGNTITISDTKPYITSVGKLANLTVAGNVVAGNLTVSNVPTITAVTVPGTIIQSANVVNGIRTTDTYRTPTGIITGGTYVPFNRAYSYTGDNDTPSKFTATVGDGKGLKIELKCPNCTVDFK